MYEIMGHKAVQRDDNQGFNADNADAQRVPASEVIYSTDDREEAVKIMEAGGFVRGDDWFVATSWNDTDNQAANSAQGGVIRKGAGR